MKQVISEFSEQGIQILKRLILQTAANLTAQMEAFSIEPWDWRNIDPVFNIGTYNVFYTDFRLEKQDLIQIMESEAVLLYESIQEFVGAAEPMLSHAQVGLITKALSDFQTFAKGYEGLIEPRTWTDKNTYID